jgi:hypothetical protein
MTEIEYQLFTGYPDDKTFQDVAFISNEVFPEPLKKELSNSIAPSSRARKTYSLLLPIKAISLWATNKDLNQDRDILKAIRVVLLSLLEGGG